MKRTLLALCCALPAAAFALPSFDEVRAAIPWQADTRVMWDNVVAVPRLTAFYQTGMPLPHPLLTQARDRLSAHYRDELGEPFTSAMHVADVTQVATEIGLDFTLASGGSHLDLSPQGKRAALARAHLAARTRGGRLFG